MPSSAAPKSSVGAVVIGRNEGERLASCLASVLAAVDRVVYVDSGSVDGSAALAQKSGAITVDLDPKTPFCAARARNAGFEALLAGSSRPEFVQFIDGDCELQRGWITKATSFLRQNPGVAVVSGRRRERFAERSVYNRLCDWEWDTPIGLAEACGGDALMRTEAVNSVGGFNSDLIAGEEPELCVRLRAKGWQVWRLDTEMTLHDAAMTRFGQWWRRTRRAGHAYAEGAALHGHLPERHGVRGTARALMWGLGVPATALSLSMLHPAGLLVLLAWPFQIVRLVARHGGGRIGWERSLFLLLGKIPEAIGVLEFVFGRLSNRRSSLIEYK